MSSAAGVMTALPELAEFRLKMRGFLAFSESASEAAGITAQQYQMLQIIGTAGVSGVGVSELAQRLLVKHHSAVELVDRGERGGLVKRVADASDQRRSIVQMTARGRTLLGRLVQGHLGYLQEHGNEMMQALGKLVRRE